MEKKLDGLVALFAQPETARAPSTTRDGLPIGQSPAYFNQRSLESQSVPARSEAGHPPESLQSITSTPTKPSVSPQVGRDWSKYSHHGDSNVDMTLHDLANSIEAEERSEPLPKNLPTLVHTSSLLESNHEWRVQNHDEHPNRYGHSRHEHSSHSLSNAATTPGRGRTPQTSVGNGGATSGTVTKDMVDLDRAELLMTEFRDMTPFFPFVVLSPGTTAQSMSLHKPMLFLAILMTTSYSDRQLQVALEEHYRRELATRVFVNGQKSLDHLQSILVYLAW